MVFSSLMSLQDLCGIRIAHLMWIRCKKTVNCITTDPTECDVEEELKKAVLADVQSLPLPQKGKSYVLKHTRPAGERLLSLLRLWFSKMQLEGTDKCLISDMLFDCLTLNGDGLINQRKTAEMLLSHKMLPNIFAFQLACINCLEREVLNLWILVKEYFLNKIKQETGHPHLFNQKYCYRNVVSKIISLINNPDFMLKSSLTDTTQICPIPCTTEPDEVLFWIGYCVSKKNEINIKEVPHFMGNDVDWYKFLLESAAFSGNVACFDYIKNFYEKKFEYDYVHMIEKILTSAEKDHQQPSFIFHFILLNFEEKTELFRKFPIEMVSQFLQWPLSETFLENTEGVWNLIPDECKYWIFSEIYKMLNDQNILLHPVNEYNYHRFLSTSIDMKDVTYCVEHLLGIWIALWTTISDSYKSTFLNSFVFPDFEINKHYKESPTRFETSGLKQKLLRLFLSNGEALVELYQSEDLKESLRSLLTKFMPNDFEDLDRTCIPFLEIQKEQFRISRKMLEKKIACPILTYPCNPVDSDYLSYIMNLNLVSSSRN